MTGAEPLVVGLLLAAVSLWNRWFMPKVMSDQARARWEPFVRLVGGILAAAGLLVAVVGLAMILSTLSN